MASVSVQGDTIVFDVVNGNSHYVSADEIDSPEKLAYMAYHMAGKTWMTTELLQQFMRLASTLAKWNTPLGTGRYSR
jgi:Neuraminidase (sialidase)